MRTIVFFCYFIIYMIAVIPAGLYTVHLFKTQPQKAEEKMAIHVKNWAKRLLWVGGAQVQVTGKHNIPTNRPVLFCANHQGDYDIPILLAHLDKPHGFIAKVETLKIPLVRDWMKLLHCVFLDRDNPREAVRALNQAAENIKAGHSMIIFPEGTRSRGDHMGEFKSGFTRIATKAGADIVPVVIDGSYKLFEANHHRMKKGVVRVKILPPISTSQLDREQVKNLGQTLHDIIWQEKQNMQ